MCTFFGYLLSNKYIRRKKYFNDFYLFNKNLQTELNFSKSSILKIIEDFSEKNSDFYYFITKYFKKKNEEVNLSYLSSDEKDSAKKYLGSISTVDDKTLIGYVNGYSQKLSEMLELSVREEKKYKTLYIKLGFLFGLIIFIVLI